MAYRTTHRAWLNSWDQYHNETLSRPAKAGASCYWLCVRRRKVLRYPTISRAITHSHFHHHHSHLRSFDPFRCLDTRNHYSENFALVLARIQLFPYPSFSKTSHHFLFSPCTLQKCNTKHPSTLSKRNSSSPKMKLTTAIIALIVAAPAALIAASDLPDGAHDARPSQPRPNVCEDKCDPAFLKLYEQCKDDPDCVAKSRKATCEADYSVCISSCFSFVMFSRCPE